MTTASNDPEFIRRRNRGRLQLLLLAAIFLGPLALAFALYYGNLWTPESTAEHGVLIEPPRRLPADLLGGSDAAADTGFVDHWTLLVMEPAACDEACRQVLYETRQLRRALGREIDRVRRVWVPAGGEVDRGFLATEHPDLEVVAVSTPRNRQLRELIGSARPGEVFLIDPLGNLMMRFPPGLSMRAMHTDLKRLLRVSRIG